MNPIGASTWIWTSPLNGQTLHDLAGRLAGWGFDLIELPVEQPGDWDPARAADRLEEVGLGAGVCAAMGPGRDLTSRDADVVRATQRYLRACVDAAAAVGAGVVAGPLYSPTGDLPPPLGDERARALDRLTDALRSLADYAGERGVTLALEPLNRFETGLVNTVDQGLDVVERVDSPALGLLLDTFHMNIEERDLPAAIRAAGARLTHFHACGPDRGAPGGDHVDWTGIVSALADVGYQGALCIESFTPDNATIARAASIWRALAPSPDDLALAGLGFLRSVLDDAPPGTR